MEMHEDNIRRKEMSNLFSSLRSLLPIDYIKEKRSLNDDLEEAARYVKELEKNVKELEHKRHTLRKSSPENHFRDLSSSSSIHGRLNDGDCVSIYESKNGVEIEISAEIGEDDPVFPLSLVVQVLLEEGLDVISCVSSKINHQRSVYVLHCQVIDEKFVDSSRLQGRLRSQISSKDSIRASTTSYSSSEEVGTSSGKARGEEEERNHPDGVRDCLPGRIKIPPGRVGQQLPVLELLDSHPDGWESDPGGWACPGAN